MCSPDIIVDILLIADQYNGSHTKVQTVNHIADYECLFMSAAAH